MLNCTTSGHGGGVLPAIPFHQTRHVTDETDADRRGTDTRGGWSGGSSVRPRRQRIQKSASVSEQPTNRWLVSGLRYASARLDRRSTPTVRLSVECFRRLNSGGECGAPRGRGGGRHGFRGASGGGSARGPGFPSDLCPPRAPLALCFHPPEPLQCSVCLCDLSADISLWLWMISARPSTEGNRTPAAGVGWGRRNVTQSEGPISRILFVSGFLSPRCDLSWLWMISPTEQTCGRRWLGDPRRNACRFLPGDRAGGLGPAPDDRGRGPGPPGGGRPAARRGGPRLPARGGGRSPPRPPPPPLDR